MFCNMEILALLISAVAIGAIIYLGVTLTAAIIRKFRTRRNTKVLVADMATFIKNMPDKEKHSISFDNLETYKDAKFISEFDPETNEIVQTKICDKGMDSQISSCVDHHGGYIIVGD